jgi:hypothetical protein
MHVRDKNEGSEEGERGRDRNRIIMGGKGFVLFIGHLKKERKKKKGESWGVLRVFSVGHKI